MDALSHALAGSLIADALPFTRRLGMKAQVAAIAAGMAPDLDILPAIIAKFPPTSLSYKGVLDEQVNQMYHRTFTHSFFYTALAAIVLSFAARRLSGRGKWWQWALLLGLALFSHITLDILNPWDVHCWLPFSRQGEAWVLMPLQDVTFIGLMALAFVLNHVLRDPFAETGENGAVLPAWQARTSTFVNRWIGVPTLAWVVIALLVLRVWSTLWGLFPYPVVLS